MNTPWKILRKHLFFLSTAIKLQLQPWNCCKPRAPCRPREHHEFDRHGCSKQQCDHKMVSCANKQKDLIKTSNKVYNDTISPAILLRLLDAPMQKPRIDKEYMPEFTWAGCLSCLRIWTFHCQHVSKEYLWTHGHWFFLALARTSTHHCWRETTVPLGTNAHIPSNMHHICLVSSVLAT